MTPANKVFGPPVALEENPLGASTAVLAAGAALIAWIFWKSRKTKSCATPTADIALFDKAIGYTTIYVDNKLASTWKPESLAKGSKVYSAADCSYFKWSGTAWVKDTATNEELAAWLQVIS